MGEWQGLGSRVCRHGILSGRSDEPELVATSVVHDVHLRRCRQCGSWWKEGEREAHVIGEGEARTFFLAVFAD